MKGSARATAGCDGEVLFAMVNAPFLVGACDGVLETGRVGGVAGDGDVNVFKAHDCNAFGYVVCAVDADCRSFALGVCGFLDDCDFAGVVVHFGLDVGEAVDTRDDESGVFAETVQYDFQGLFADLVCGSCDTDCAFCRCEGFVTCEESETLGFFTEQHSSEIAVSETDLTLFCDGAGDAEGLETNTDRFGCVCRVFATLLDCDSATDGICPNSVFKSDRLDAFDDTFHVDAVVGANLFGVLDACDAVLSEDGVDFVYSSFIAFKSDAHGMPPYSCLGSIHLTAPSSALYLP